MNGKGHLKVSFSKKLASPCALDFVKILLTLFSDEVCIYFLIKETNF